MKGCAYRNCFNTGYNRNVQPPTEIVLIQGTTGMSNQWWILGEANEAVASGPPKYCI